MINPFNILKKALPTPAAKPALIAVKSDGTPVYAGPVSEAIKTSERPKTPNLSPYSDLPTRWPVSPQSIATICRKGKLDPVVLDEEIDRLNKSQTRYDAIYSFLMANTYDSARQAYSEQKKKLAKNLAEGKIEDAHRELWTPEDFQQEAQLKRSAAKLELQAELLSNTPTYTAIVDRIARACLSLHDSIAAEEKERSSDFGVPFVPSEILIRIGQLSWTIARLKPVIKSTSPNAFLRSIGVIS